MLRRRSRDAYFRDAAFRDADFDDATFRDARFRDISSCINILNRTMMLIIIIVVNSSTIIIIIVVIIITAITAEATCQKHPTTSQPRASSPRPHPGRVRSSIYHTQASYATASSMPRRRSRAAGPREECRTASRPGRRRNFVAAAAAAPPQLRIRSHLAALSPDNKKLNAQQVPRFLRQSKAGRGQCLSHGPRTLMELPATGLLQRPRLKWHGLRYVYIYTHISIY